MNCRQWIILAVILFVLNIIWYKNKKNNVENDAPVTKYSNTNTYKHITPMKHDIFKQLTIDIVPLLLLGIISYKELINLEKFEESPLGKSLLTGVGYAIFYQYVQPYIVNRLPNF
jgi:hypothetical protein